MTKQDRLMRRILSGTADANVVFADMITLLRGLGFTERIKGSHHIFTRDDVAEIVNLQPKGDMAKPYQVKQVRGMLVRYKLGGTDA